MSLNRIYGQDVIVRLLSQKGNIPYIIDFDSIEINSLTTTQSYKSVGRTLQRHQAINTGYKIVLTRSKRDNHLQSLVHFNDYHIQKGLEQPFFLLEYSVNHTYSLKNYDVLDRLTGKSINSSSSRFNTNDLNNGTNFKIPSIVSNGALKLSEAILKSNPLIKNAIDTGNNLKTIGNNGVLAVNAIINSFQDSSSRTIYSLPEYQQLQTLLKTIDTDFFLEKYNYNNCVIGEFSSSDRVSENSIETITLYATDKGINSDENYYDDEYLGDKFGIQLTEGLESKKDQVLKKLDTNKPQIIDEVKRAFNKSLEEIYGNLIQWQ